MAKKPIPMTGDLFPDWTPPPPPLKRKGHAGTPGEGPEGETCRSCQNYTLRMYSKVYRKCWLVKDGWTKGPATDIKAGDLACEKWEKWTGERKEA